MKMRNLMKDKRGLCGFMAGMLALLLLFACLPACAPAAEEEAPAVEEVGAYEAYVSSLPQGSFPVPQDCFEQAVEEGELCIYDWAEWWPEEIYEGFSQEFGIKIVRDNFADLDEMLAKFKLNPETEYDCILPDVRAFSQMKELGVLQQLNHDWIPNVNAYLPEATKEAWYDPGYQYAVATELVFTAYGYNADHVDDSRIPSWSVVFEPDEKYKGRISLVNDMYEVIGSALKYLGYSLNSVEEDQLMEAKELLLRLKPAVMTFDSWPARLMLEEEVWIAHQWYGDAWFLHQELESITPAMPTEGTKLGSDSMVIPIASNHPAAAHLFMNYVLRPRVNALLLQTIGYLPNHTAAGEFLSQDLRDLTPPQEYFDKCEYVKPESYTGIGKDLRFAVWEELKA